MDSAVDQLVLFFGYRPGCGHDLQSKGSRVNIYTDTPWGTKLDGGLLTADYYRAQTNPDGKWVEHHKDGWTAIAFWDRSGDSRPGSNSSFLVHADIPGIQLLAIARQQWPEIFKRPMFPIPPEDQSP